MDSQEDQKLQKVVSATKTQLGRHITKPVLAEKHLTRPPFRFLLEIISNVVQQTGFMKETFSPNDLKYEELPTPEDRRNVLRKAIEAIENETGEKCAARTSKILSGKEADKTNEMLQLLAKAISIHARKERRKSEEVKPPKEACSVPKNNTGESRKEKKSSPKKSKKVASKAPIPLAPVARKTSSQTKGKSPGDKGTNLVKPSPSASRKSEQLAAKKSSKESVKSKSATLSVSSSTMPDRKSSGTSLKKSLSRQSVSGKVSPKKAETMPREDSEPSPDPKQHLKRSESQTKVPSPKPSSLAISTAMPPANLKQVPKHRPVTRTKFRQKMAEDGMENQSAPDENDNSIKALEEPDNTKGSEATTSNARPPSSKLADEQVSNTLINENFAQKGESLIDPQPQLKSCEEECPATVRSTSSDDAVTEYMNRKICEWRASSAEVVYPEMPKELLPKSATAWMKDEPEGLDENKSQIKTRKVFASEENCSVSGHSEGYQSAPQKAISEDKKISLRPVTVLRDNESDNEDDDAFLVEETMEHERDYTLERLQQSSIMQSSGRDINNLSNEGRSSLVKQILQTQRELESLSSSGRGRILQNEMEERDKAAVREVYLKQMEDLKAAIQKMSKCANPLANVIQRSQDDACLMEIEFRKLRQENDKLQRMIDDAKEETSRSLYPLTEELAQLDNRIGKVDGAIILAKQRLSLIDAEYSEDFMRELENTPTPDEALAGPLQTDPIWQYPNCDEDVTKKSLLDVFKRAVTMHDEVPLPHPGAAPRQDNFHSSRPSKLSRTPKRAQAFNTTIVGNDSPGGRRTTRILRQLEQEQPEPVYKENKPSWWD